MTSRCLNCNGIVTKTDRVCFSCGDSVPKWVSSVPGKQASTFSVVSNIVFFASLGLTAFSLVSEHKLPLNVSLSASGVLLAVKLIVDWTSRQRSKSSTT